jgi:hypothetical protein
MLHDFIGLLAEDVITYSWFQQDSAAAHTANNSMKLLHETLGERVISRNLWSPRSPDLIPLDFICGEQQNLQCIVIAHASLNELKTVITAYIRNISQADLQKVFANKIKRVQACIDARGHHFQHLFYVHSDFPNALYYSIDKRKHTFCLMKLQVRSSLSTPSKYSGRTGIAPLILNLGNRRN